jgi:hypothetical protein
MITRADSAIRRRGGHQLGVTFRDQNRLQLTIRIRPFGAAARTALPIGSGTQNKVVLCMHGRMADDRAGSIPASSASGSEVAPIAGKSGSMRVAACRGLRRLAGQRDWAGCNAVSGPGGLHDEMPGSPAPADPGAGTTSRCWA